jgi:metallo-beta-lactamase class B
VGTKPVSAWAIDTSEGIILIDTLSHDDDARALEAALKDLGLDPARIKYMIIAHGSGDHYGGARYFQEKYGARVVMTDVEWTWMEHRCFDAHRWVWGRGRPPDRGIAVADGDKLQLGDTVVELYLTPGHTPGSLAAIFSVTDGGQRHRVLFTGGASFNVESKAPTLQKFVLSMGGLRDAVQREHVDIHITSHGRYDGVLERWQR